MKKTANEFDKTSRRKNLKVYVNATKGKKALFDFKSYKGGKEGKIRCKIWLEEKQMM